MKTLRESFDEKWIPVPESGCWLWVGAIGADGYGSIRAKGKTCRAHRVSWELHCGPIPEGEGYHGTCVLHKCDTPECVRPEHLVLGTPAENSADMAAKKRSTIGERNPQAKLTEGEVLEIREDPRLYREIAEDYGVVPTAISLIKRRKRWGHV